MEKGWCINEGKAGKYDKFSFILESLWNVSISQCISAAVYRVLCVSSKVIWEIKYIIEQKRKKNIHILFCLFQNVPNIVHCATMLQSVMTVYKATSWLLKLNAKVGTT